MMNKVNGEDRNMISGKIINEKDLQNVNGAEGYEWFKYTFHPGDFVYNEDKTRRYVVIETVNTNDDNAFIKTITSFDESSNPQTDGIISFTANELCQMCLKNGGRIDML